MSTGSGSIGVGAVAGQGGGVEVVAPSGLTATATPNGVQLAWTPGTAPAQQVEFQIPGSAWAVIATGLGASAGAFLHDAGDAPANTLLAYRVRATGAGADVLSNTAPALTYPAAAFGLAAEALSTDTVRLTWTAPGAGADSQRIERAPAGSGLWTTITGGLVPTLATYDDTGLAATTAYSYRVVTTNPIGERTSAAVTVVTLADIPADVPVIMPVGRIIAPPRLQLLLWDAPREAGGGIVADLSPWLTQAVITANLHGDRDCRLQVDRPLAEALILYLRRGALHLEARCGDCVIWEGRVASPSLVAGERAGWAATALGYWEALGDVPVTDLWSEADLGAWREVTAQDRAGRTPGKFITRVGEVISIGLKNGVTYGTATRGGVIYQIPDGGTRGITQIGLTLTHYLPSSAFRAVVSSVAAGTRTILLSINGTGAVATVTQTLSIVDPADTLLIEIEAAAGAGAYTGSDDDHFVEVSAAQVRTTTGAALDPATIVRDIVGQVAGANPGQISLDTLRIQATATDRSAARWEDADAREILDQLAADGDGTAPWEVGVGPGRRVFFRPRGTGGQAWAVTATELELAQDRADLANALYGTWEDANGRTRRTATAADETSVRRYGLRRVRAVATRDGGATQAQRSRDAALVDGASPKPEARWRFRTIRTLGGVPVPGWLVRPGDTITEVGLSPAYDGTVDRLRTFRIAERTYDLLTGEIDVVPEKPPATIDRLLAE